MSLSQLAATSLHSAVPSQGGPYSLDEHTSQTTNNASLVGQDLWKQLRRVTIPVFSGDKRTYQNWRAAFINCVDQAPATPEYKLLQLRQCLAGEALKSIENLGYFATAYCAALDRLERKFGGERRKITIYLEEIDNFRPVRHGNSKDIEKYADLLDVAIVNLKESNRSEELKDGMLYIKLQKKLPAQMLAAYHCWVFENHRVECVEVLREWVIQEAEFHSRALETVQGLTTPNLKSILITENHREHFLLDHSLDMNLLMILRVKAEVIDLVGFVANHMEFGVVENLNRWMCQKGGKMQKNLDCVFVV